MRGKEKGRWKQQLLLLYFLLFTGGAFTQTKIIQGYVLDAGNREPLPGVRVQLRGNENVVFSGPDGYFEISSTCNKECLLVLDQEGYDLLRIPLNPEEGLIVLGQILLSRNNPVEKREVLLTLSETDLEDDEGMSDVVGFLQGSRDIFLNRAAFDFSQVFFRVRGYDSSEGLVLINGLPMNKLYNGRPQWNNWGGLNDILRNQTQRLYLEASEDAFGGLLGGVNFNINPSILRPGMRISSSASNRSYTGRLMATYASGNRDKGLSVAFSLSRRWASQGYMEGTLYDAYSLFGALEYDFGKGSRLSAYGIYARNRRGRNSPITQEVFQMAGRRYNPNWGWQEGRIRNARERLISEPIFMFNYQLKSQRMNFRMGIAYQFGSQAQGRLGYFNAPNPDPAYYRYLPSYYLNSSFGTNYENAHRVRQEFLGEGQISWEDLYLANANRPGGKAAYLSYSQVEQGHTLIAGMRGNIKVARHLHIDLGLFTRNTNARYFSRLEDLLGASYHEDVDPFSDTRNNMLGAFEIGEGELFAYHFEINQQALDAYVQGRLETKHWEAFGSVAMASRKYQRVGRFQNARYPDNSLGTGPEEKYAGLLLKCGLGYKPNARVLFNIRGTSQQRPPLPREVFIQPRENHEGVAYTSLPTVTSFEMNTLLRFPNLNGRISAYTTHYTNTTKIGQFFTDSGLGSDFVYEVVRDAETRHQGLEFGLEYQPSSTVTLSLAGSFGAYRYLNNPRTLLYFDVSEDDQDPIHPSGKADLGEAQLQGLYLGRGPQQAISFGISYRDPDYWFVSTSLNRLSRNFIDVSVLPRTQSFFLDPETRDIALGIDNDLIGNLTKQSPLPPVYLLNMVGGKSWLFRGTYIGLFASVSNVLDTTFRTGGFEQSRNGHYKQYLEDNLSANPLFGPKFWYGYGRTFFVNLSLSF